MKTEDLKEKILKELFIIDNEFHTKRELILNEAVKSVCCFDIFSKLFNLREKQYYKYKETIKKIFEE